MGKKTKETSPKIFPVYCRENVQVMQQKRESQMELCWLPVSHFSIWEENAEWDKTKAPRVLQTERRKLYAEVGLLDLQNVSLRNSVEYLPAHACEAWRKDTI